MSKTIAEHDLAEEPQSTQALNRAPPEAATPKKKRGRPKKSPTAIRGNLNRRPKVTAATRVPTATRRNLNRQPNATAVTQVPTATRRNLKRRLNVGIRVPTAVCGNLHRQPKPSADARIPTATRDNLDREPTPSAAPRVPTAIRGKRGGRRANATSRVHSGIHGNIAHVRGGEAENVGEAVQNQKRREAQALAADEYTRHEGDKAEEREPTNCNQMGRNETVDDEADDTIDEDVPTDNRGRNAEDAAKEVIDSASPTSDELSTSTNAI
ncbi:hypothetical protein AAVH_10845 [Aphelenchoides avenae]|nr:hypothetical protein AAVH_10845 [Aphelenchus avenae]